MAEEHAVATVSFEPEKRVQNCYARIYQQISGKVAGNMTFIFRYVIEKSFRKKMIPKKGGGTGRFFEL